MPLHFKLESLLRSWAKEIKSNEREVVLETQLPACSAGLSSIADRLISRSPVWLYFGSTEMGDAEILELSRIETALRSACDTHRMVSFVDPLTGGGLTIDVSDEGNPLPTLQVAGWGDCASLCSEIGKNFPAVHWIKGAVS